MKTIKFALSGALCALAFAAFAQDADEQKNDSVGFQFTDITIVKHTPVKDQNKSGTCWSFAGTALLEDEILRKGGPETDLSEMFTVRHCYSDKADSYIRRGGKTQFAQGGAIGDVIYVLDKYGLVPEDAYTGLQYGEEKHSHYELFDAIEGYLNGVSNNKNKRLSSAWKNGYEGILDAYFGKLPETFVYQGKTYTPRSFADSFGLKGDDFMAFTSYTHHPFYTAFPIEVADNWLWDTSMNVPMEEMKAILDNALQNGYSVCWAADVSEGGFKWTEGFAVLPDDIDTNSLEGTELSRWVTLSDKDREAEKFKIKGPCKEKKVTQESRQKGFDNFETTDDHGMMIVGIAQDQEGNRFYKVKNSWDTNQIYSGYIYVSEPYFLDKTLGILVNKGAVPADIAKKTGIRK